MDSTTPNAAGLAARVLNLVFEERAYFVACKAKIAHGGSGARVIEPFGRDLEAHTRPCALHEPESFPGSERSVVSVVEMYLLVLSLSVAFTA